MTILMPRDLAEPMMLLTTFCMEVSCSLKLSSCDLTCAISYTALTVTIPAISCPDRYRKVEGGEEKERGDETQQHRKRNQQEVWLVMIEQIGSGDGVKARGNRKKGGGKE